MEQEQQNNTIASLFSDIIRDLMRSPLKECTIDLGQGQIRMLLYLLDHPNGVSSGELSEATQVGTGRIGNALKDMQKKGLVTKSRSRRDHRVMVIRATKKGLEFAQRKKDAYTRLVEKIINKIGYDKFYSFLLVLQQILNIDDDDMVKEVGNV